MAEIIKHKIREIENGKLEVFFDIFQRFFCDI